jgi:diguanylate cyclase (GGDEF)-like protein
MTFLICALFLFITPALYNILIPFCAIAVFIVSNILVKEPQNWIFDVVNVLIAGLVSLVFGWQITRLRLASALYESELEEENTIDELTQLKNRRDFMQTFHRRLSTYRSSDDWLCIAIMDIDYFKDYNDHYGHPQGDECLRSIGKVLNELGDIGVYTARVGGEEFALIWHENDTSHISTTISQIQRMIKELNIPHEKSKVAPHVTVSIGIHTIRSGESDDMHILYDKADKALYAAKRNGRNRAVVHGMREILHVAAVDGV